MKKMNSYMCDGRTPTDAEIAESIKIAADEGVIVKLEWFVPYNGWHFRLIRSGDTLEEVKAKLPKDYGL